MLTDDTTTDPPPTTDPDLRRFVEQSTSMTGFATYDLYGTGMAQLYLDTARHQVGGAARFKAFLDAWQQSSDGDGTAALTPVDREIARAVTYLWYTGAWPRLAPAAHAALRREMPNTEFVASVSSYPEGLVWRAFAGHPAGAKPPGFGTWAEEPPELPTEEEIREELLAVAVEDPSVETAAKATTYAATAFAADLPGDGVPAHLLPGVRLSRGMTPSAVPAAAAQPGTRTEEASE
ncbi:hypothetical protein ACIQ6Y_35405 [Streptomyces sp. NPDC096205]|uniref:hypothetical protein n=1 Tax=Streptomyces sp. NPDC096205 TaxID=3366081 RepID=UPI0038151F8E